MGKIATRKEDIMRKPSGFQVDMMVLALIVWVCTLPLVALLIVPWLGINTALLVALALLLVVLILCWGICGWQALKDCFDA